MSNPTDVAQWMFSEVTSKGVLHQDEAAAHITKHFGSHFFNETDTGSRSLDQKVLRAFRKLSEATVTYDKSARAWRTV